MIHPCTPTNRVLKQWKNNGETKLSMEKQWENNKGNNNETMGNDNERSE
jgi:hypothetical protein